VNGDGDEYITITEHVHTPNPDENISTEFKSQICTKAAICHDPPRRIIHEALLNIDQADGAAVPTYYSQHWLNSVNSESLRNPRNPRIIETKY